MKNGEFKEGRIKGRDLKGYTLFQVLPGEMDMQYKEGSDLDAGPSGLPADHSAGLYCFLADHIYDSLDFRMGNCRLATVTIPDDEDVYVEMSADTPLFRAERFVIGQVMSFDEMATWEYLHKNGLDITDNRAIVYAAMTGSLEAVKYLHGNGSDITADNNSAAFFAACRGHLEIVRYCHENGAGITGCGSMAVRGAVENRHLDVAGYLYQNGENIMYQEFNEGSRVFVAGMFNDRLSYKEGIISKKMYDCLYVSVNGMIPYICFMNGDLFTHDESWGTYRLFKGEVEADCFVGMADRETMRKDMAYNIQKCDTDQLLYICSYLEAAFPDYSMTMESE